MFIQKIIIFFIVMLLTFSFRYTILSIIENIEVDGVKYFSPFTSGAIGNGNLHFIYEYPLLTFSIGKEADWKQCWKLHKSVDYYLKLHIDGWPQSSPYYYVKSSGEQGYSAYLKANDKLVLLRGFPDFGGTGPSEEEKKICAD